MIQIVKMTRQEKIAMYMRVPKKKLAEMLCEANEALDSILPLQAYSTDYNGRSDGQKTDRKGR